MTEQYVIQARYKHGTVWYVDSRNRFLSDAVGRLKFLRSQSGWGRVESRIVCCPPIENPGKPFVIDQEGWE